MEGKVAQDLFSLPATHFSQVATTMRFSSWATQFLTHIIHLSHSQWIFRNSSLHDKNVGYLRLRKRRELLHEIVGRG